MLTDGRTVELVTNAYPAWHYGHAGGRDIQYPPDGGRL